jgi:hypothetical protein
MNGIIRDLSKIIPGVSPLEQKINKANVLKQALAHILVNSFISDPNPPTLTLLSGFASSK